MRTTEFLNPRRKLVEEVADWLCGTGAYAGRGRVRTSPEGARTLDHVAVVVPTAQSGRNLRLAVARRFPGRGVVPPRVVQPMQLVRPADETLREATPVEVAAAFLKFLETRPRRHVEKRGGRDALVVDEWTHLFRGEAFQDREAAFSLLDQLLDIWRVLCGGGLLMRDVPANADARKVLEAALGDEVARWQELGALEAAFFAFLEARGLRHPAARVHLAKTRAAAVAVGIEEVVLPALADPVAVLYDVLRQQRDALKVSVLLHCAREEAGRFDAWGRPRVDGWTGRARPVVEGLAEADIVCAANGADLAKRLVADFPPARSAAALPSLALCDGELFPELSAAFLNAGYVVHNPECHRLAASSLGRLVRDLLAAWTPAACGVDWDVFVAVLRADDVLSALKRLGLVESRAAVLEGLDIFQNRRLPRFAADAMEAPSVEARPSERPKVAAFAAAARAVLSWLAEARETGSPADFVRAFLKRTFGERRLTGAAGEEELRAAAACVRDVLDGLSSEPVRALGLGARDLQALARRALEAATYALEPAATDAVKTEGWLELGWSEGDRIALAGLHEGAVPDAVVGHAFLPDALREALGLVSNAARLARDTWLLRELVDSHAPRAVRAYVARTTDAGDICRPSRLLFLCDDARHAARVEYLFGDLGASSSATPPRELAARWRLRLPDAVPLPHGRLTASALETYLSAPFVYLLRYGLGMEAFEEKRELGFDDFGALLHKVLERYANEQFDASEAGRDQLSDEAAIRARIGEIADGVFARFGAPLTANLRLQLEAARGRLEAFAKVQATWAADGWRVGARAERTFQIKPFADLDVEVRGSVDRIDCRVGPDGRKEFRLVDYKTWDDASQAASHVRARSAEQIAFADRLGLPTTPPDAAGVRTRLLTVQLPLYGRCLEVDDPGTFAGRIVDYCYLVLGADAENVKPYGSALPFGGRKPPAQAVKLLELRELALETARTAMRRITENVFWPPRAAAGCALHDFAGLVLLSPERDQGEGEGRSAWLKAQEAKLEALA